MTDEIYWAFMVILALRYTQYLWCSDESNLKWYKGITINPSIKRTQDLSTNE